MGETAANFHDTDSNLSRIKEILFGPEIEVNNDSLDDGISDPDIPFNESWLLEVFNTTTATANVPSLNHMYDSQEGTSEKGEEKEKNFGNPMPLEDWSFPPVPYTCSCCQVLRQIIHSNGTHTVKLEIHGKVGFIYHAILDNLYASESHQDYRMFDFCPESIEGVKNFLKNYLQERKLSGYTVLQDSFSIFYETICIGFDWLNNLTAINHFCGNYTADGGLGSLGSYQTYQGEANNHATKEHETGQPEAGNCTTDGLQLYQPQASSISSDPLMARNQAENSNFMVNPPLSRNEALRDKNMENPLVIRDQAEAKNTTANPLLVRNHAEASVVWPNLPVTWNQPAGNNGGTEGLVIKKRAETCNAAENPMVIKNQAGDSNAAAGPLVTATMNYTQRRTRSYKEQRARAKELTYEQVANYFHLPLKEAANAIGLAETTVKKVAHLGISRWPYRDVKKIRRQMSLLQGKLTSAYEPEREQARAHIQRLEQELVDIRNGNISR